MLLGLGFDSEGTNTETNRVPSFSCLDLTLFSTKTERFTETGISVSDILSRYTQAYDCEPRQASLSRHQIIENRRRTTTKESWPLWGPRKKKVTGSAI